MLAVGPGRYAATASGLVQEPMASKVGDEVLFAKYSGAEIEHEDRELLIIRESDVLAIL